MAHDPVEAATDPADPAAAQAVADDPRVADAPAGRGPPVEGPGSDQEVPVAAAVQAGPVASAVPGRVARGRAQGSSGLRRRSSARTMRRAATTGRRNSDPARRPDVGIARRPARASPDLDAREGHRPRGQASRGDLGSSRINRRVRTSAQTSSPRSSVRDRPRTGNGRAVHSACSRPGSSHRASSRRCVPPTRIRRARTRPQRRRRSRKVRSWSPVGARSRRRSPLGDPRGACS